MGVWSVLFMSAMPVFRLLVHCGIGAYLSSPQSNVMPADARKHINKLVFVCFMPSLIFSNLAQTVTVEKMLEWWFMPINVLLCYVIGAGIGICIYDHFKPPAHLKNLIVACCATGNSSNLPLVLMTAICVEAGSPFGRYDVCTANGVAYISYGLWMSTVLTWTVVFNYLKPQPVPGYEQVDHHHEEDDHHAPASSSVPQPLALVPPKEYGFQAPDIAGSRFTNDFQGPQGFINTPPTQSFYNFQQRPPFQNPQFSQELYNRHSQSYLQQQGFQPRASFHDYNHAYGYNQGFNDGFNHPQGFQASLPSDGFQSPPIQPPAFQFQTPPPPPQPRVLPPQSQAAAPATPHAQPLTDDFSLANLQLWAEKYKLKEAFTPPTTAAAIAIPIGTIPFFRHLLYGHAAPFRFLGDALTILGEAMIPCMNLLLGGNLSQGFGSSELGLEIVIAIMLTRLLLLPMAGLIVVKLALSMGLIPVDPLFHFVLLLQFTMPTAINVGTMTQLFGVGQTECSIILFWCYTSSIVFLTLWTMIFLVLLI